MDVSPTSLPQWSNYLFNIYNIQKHYSKYYLCSRTSSLVIFSFSVMYMAWCLTLYHLSTAGHSLAVYNSHSLR